MALWTSLPLRDHTDIYSHSISWLKKHAQGVDFMCGSQTLPSLVQISTVPNRQYPQSQAPSVMKTYEQKKNNGSSDKCGINHFSQIGLLCFINHLPLFKTHHWAEVNAAYSLQIKFLLSASVFISFLLLFSACLCFLVSFHLSLWWNIWVSNTTPLIRWRNAWFAESRRDIHM